MRKRRYLLALVGTTAALAVGAGAAIASPHHSSHARRSHTSHSGTCPNMGSAST
jgi:hypothetical protein